MKNGILIALTICFIASFLWALFFSDKKAVDRILEKAGNKQQIDDLSLRTVKVSEIVDGVKYWEFNAKGATFNRFYQAASLATVKGDFFENEMPVLQINAPQATWQMKARELAMKQIKGKSLTLQQEISFASPHMTWRLANKKLETHQGVVIKTGNLTLKGKHLVGDVGLNKVILEGNPQASIRL